MELFKKILRKLFSFTLIAALILNVVLIPMVVKAQEATPSATPEPSESPAPTAIPTSTTTPIPSTTPTPTPSSTPESTPSATLSAQTESEPTPSPAPTPSNTVTLGTTYSSPDGKAKVKFTSVSQAGTLNISQITLSSNQTQEIGALSKTVYDISSSMTNGSFTYDLTLPLPPGATENNFKVKYAQSVNDLNNAKEVGERITINNDNTFTIHNLDHFTVFVVVNPNTQANCDAVRLNTISGTTCFSTIQAAVDVSSNEDTITIGAGTYNETVNVLKQLTFIGQGNPVVTAFVLHTTPSTFTGITAGSITIATPAVSLTNPVFSGNQTNVTITGTGAANATVNYTISGTSGSVSGTNTVSPSGTINIGSIDVSSLPDGNLNLSVNLTFNSFTSQIATASAVKDTQAPALASNLSITNPIHNSNKATIALSGNGEANSTANWIVSNGPSSVSGTAAVSQGGTFSANTIDVSALPDGTLTLSVTLTDTVGNTNSAATTTTFKDAQAPTLTNVAISSSNANTSFAKVGDTANLTFTSSETIQTPVVSIAGHLVSPTNTSGNNWLASYTLTSSDTEGLISFVIDFTDFVGNAGNSVTSTTNNSSVTFDITPPNLSSTTVTTSNSNPNFAKAGNTITIALTASEGIQTPTVTIAGHTVSSTNTSGNNWTASYNVAAGDTEGLIAYTINYSDLAGNAGTPVSTNSTITFDKSAPTLTSTNVTTSNANSTYAKIGDVITVTFTSSESIQTPVVTIAGHTITATNTSGNDWTAAYTMQSSDSEGLIPYTINFQDQSSNTAAVNTNSSITFDKTAPQSPSVSLTNPVNDSNKTNIAVLGTGEANANFAWNITDGVNNVSGTGTVDGSGTVSVTNIDVTSLTNGTLTLSVTLTDQAGNTGNAGTNTSNKDTVAPTLTSTNVVSDNANATLAKVGNTITLTFTSSETIQTPAVSIAGHSITPTNTSGNNWTASYNMTSSDTEGLINYSINFADSANNAGTSINTNSAITFDKTNPSVSPVAVTSSNSNPNYAKVGDTISLNFTSSEAIQTPIVTIAGHTVTPSNTSGNTWTASYVMTSTDTEGLIAYTIDFTDSAGNTGTAVNTNSTIVFDRTAPGAPSVIMTHAVNIANQTLVTIAGTGEIGTTVNYTITDSASNTVSGTGTVDNAGVIVTGYINVSSLLDGSLELSVTITDSAGNTSTAGLYTASKDTVTPSLTVTSVTTSNTNNSYAKVGDIITVNFSTSEAVNTPLVYIAGHMILATNTSGNNWTASYTMTSTDTEGVIAYSITANDLSNNPANSISANSTITFDKTSPNSPSVSLTNPVNDSNKTNIAISGTGEANATFTWNITDGTNTVSGNGTVNGSGIISVTNINVSSLTDGTLTLSVTLTDSAGNTGSAGTGTTAKDTVTPTLSPTNVTTSNSNASLAKVGDTITVTFTSSETIQAPVITIAGHSVTASNVSGNTWTASYTMATGDTEGLIGYTIAFTDTAGNAGTAVNTNSSISFDKSAPTLTSTNITSSNTNPSYAKTGDTVTLTFTSSETIQTPVVTIAGHTVTATNTSGNIWTTTYAMVTGDTEGLIAYTITFTDSAGNSGTPVNTNSAVTFDRTSPQTPSISLTNPVNDSNKTNIAISGTGEANATFTWNITDGTNTVSGNGTVNGSGIISVTNINVSSLTDGTLTLSVTLTDSAGNTGSAGTGTTAKDTVTPTLSPTNVTTSNSNASLAKVGDTITVTFTSSETIQAPVITIAGHTVTAANTSGNTWTASYTMQASDTEGLITYTINYQDPSSNTSLVNTNSVITFDKTTPTGSWTSPLANTNVSGVVSLTTSTSDTSGTTIAFSYKRNDGVDTFHNITGNTWDTNALALDNYTLRLTVTDNAGNTTIVDQTIGVATVIAPNTIQPGTAAKDSITITWTTDDSTSSRVIYDTSSHSSLGTTPNYGYAGSTATQDISPKVTNHSVALSGLRSGTRYYYRVISAGSPEAVSEELNFTTAQAPVAQGGIGGAGGGAVGAPVCTDVSPGSAPALLSVKITGRNKVTLVWSKAKDPVTYYLIKYGLGHDSYQFGVPNVGNVGEYEIGELAPGVTYYFRIRAGNNCAPGEYSNEIAVKNSGSFVAQKVVETISSALGATTTYASEKTSYSSKNQVTNITLTDSSIATQSTLEATATADPVSSTVSSPAAIINKGNSGWRLKNILLTAGLILLIAGGVTYYRSLKNKV